MEILLVIFVLSITIFLIFYCNNFFLTEKVVSSLDNKSYVVRKSKNKQEASNILAIINIHIQKLFDNLKETEMNDTRVQKLMKRFNPNNLVENFNKKEISYTVNKGEEIGLCLSTRDEHEKIYDINTLMFVVIHELSHIGTDSLGHDENFIKLFKFLLRKSIDCGVYNYIDYSKNPVEYCGMTINSTPLKL